jgi:hypothetical protein
VSIGAFDGCGVGSTFVEGDFFGQAVQVSSIRQLGPTGRLRRRKPRDKAGKIFNAQRYTLE